MLNKVQTSEHKTETPEVQHFKTFEPVLYGIITAQELRVGLQALNAGKAPGQDEILSEYLKTFGNTYEEILLKIVNKIFSSHIYPHKWNDSF